jgi:hypothetical protein
VQALSLPVLELALLSKDLRMSSENDTFALVGGWVAGQPKSEREAAFSRLVRCLRFHRMSGDFLANVVGRSKYRGSCAFLMDACLRAFAYQSIAASSRYKVHAQHPLALCKPSRAPAEPPLHTFKVQVELAYCQATESPQAIRLGLGSGYKIMLSVEKVQAEGPAATVGLFVEFVRPAMIQVKGDKGETVSLVGPFVALRISAGGTTQSWHHVYDGDTPLWGYQDFFCKPWGEVVRDGSAYFPEGRMTVKVEVLCLSDKNALATTLPAWARP